VEIERHPAVIEEDLPGIYAHIVRDNPAPAERVLDAVEATFDEIAAQPSCGVIYPTRNPAMSDVRMLPVREFTSYLIFYRVEDDVVRVLYLAHGADTCRVCFDANSECNLASSTCSRRI
jgi:toxin ParE1/3/4